MEAKTYGMRITEMLISEFQKEFKVRQLKVYSPFQVRFKISNKSYYLHIEAQLDKSLKTLHVCIHDPSNKMNIYCNETYSMNEHYANNKMLEEAADKIYKAFNRLERKKST